MMHGFCASPLVWSLCARTMFHPDFFRVLRAQPCRAHQDKIRRLHAPDGLHHCMGCAGIVFTASSHVHPSRVLCLCHRRLPRTTMHDSRRCAGCEPETLVAHACTVSALVFIATVQAVTVL